MTSLPNLNDDLAEHLSIREPRNRLAALRQWETLGDQRVNLSGLVKFHEQRQLVAQPLWMGVEIF